MKRYSLVVLATSIGLVVVAPAAGSTDIHSPRAQISTKQGPKAVSASLKTCLKKAKGIDDPVKRKKAKKKCKKKFANVPPPAYVPPPPPPTPLALTETEVANQVNSKAQQYCRASSYGSYSGDPTCVDRYGIYVDASDQIYCSSKSTYTWSCDGWNDVSSPPMDIPWAFATCDFREVVERDGYNGIRSHQDLSYGLDAGWDCHGPTGQPWPD